MGLSSTKPLTEALTKRDYRKLKILVGNSPPERLRRWFKDAALRPHMVDSEVLTPVEYCAKGHVEDQGTVRELMEAYVECGAARELFATMSPNEVMLRVLCPAVRRDSVHVVRAVLSVTEKVGLILTAQVTTRAGGAAVQSTIVHLAAEQHAVRCLPVLLERAQASSLLAFLLQRRDGLQHTPADVAAADAADTLSHYDSMSFTLEDEEQTGFGEGGGGGGGDDDGAGSGGVGGGGAAGGARGARGKVSPLAAVRLGILTDPAITGVASGGPTRATREGAADETALCAKGGNDGGDNPLPGVGGPASEAWRT